MLLLLLFGLVMLVAALPSPNSTNIHAGRTDSETSVDSRSTSCFPALDFKMPSHVPDSLEGWWCDAADEYAFVGFSYEVTACEKSMQLLNHRFTHVLALYTGQSLGQLRSEFRDIRKTFNSRYVRLYGACDRKGF